MPDLHPINRTLLTVLENQVSRTTFAFEGLNEAVLDTPPGNDCKSIRGIIVHLIHLRRFQLTLLESPLVQKVADPQDSSVLADLVAQLEKATVNLQEAISIHDPDDWYRTPEIPREGPWGEDPTIIRFVRPLNDFTNHLGSIRAIRRIMGNPAERTQ